MQNKLIPINQKDPSFPTNLGQTQEADMVRIPIIGKFEEIDGELYYQIRGDSAFRKWPPSDHVKE